MVDEKELNELFHDILMIREKYKIINDLTQDKFNIFRILRMESDEVNTHSAFIAELLNPNGSHNLSSAFLEEFIKMFDVHSIDIKSVKVLKEEYVGRVRNDGSEGGRIDLHIKSNTGSFIIENKIFAEDQPNQLLRYHNAYPQAMLFYLTLNGIEPSEYSKGKSEIKFVAISYMKDIINWLDKCVGIAANYPLVRETLNQYINLIKSLTGQTKNKDEEVDILKIVTGSKKNTLAFLYLDSNSGKIKEALNEKMINEIKDLASELNAEVKFDKSLGKIYNGFSFRFKDFENIPVCFEPQRNGLQDIIFGFVKNLVPEEMIKPLVDNYRKEISEPKHNTPAWIVYSNWHEYRWWGNPEYEKVITGQFKCDLRKILESFKKILVQSKL